MDALKALFSSSEPFMPHGHCYLWKPGLLWLHVVSDALIASAYLSIPFTLAYFARKRRDLPFRWLFVSFGLFIVACGATHALEVWNVWRADYWLAGGVKVVTAAISVATAVLLARAVPEALTLPTPGELQRANQDLARLHRQLQHAYDEATRRSQERYRALVEAATDAVVSAGDSGGIVLFNAAAERIFGYTASEVLGREAWVLAAPEVAERLRANLARFLATGEGEIVGRTVELQARRKSGELFPAELSLSVSKEEGRPVFTGFIRDISQRRRVEADLHLRTTALEAAANAVVITDREGAIIWTNPAFTALTGYALEEARSRNPRLLKSEAQDRAFYEDMWRTILGGDVWKGSLLNRRKDGSLYHEEMTITPLRSEAGEITHFIAVKEDVSDRKRLESEHRRLAGVVEATTDFVGMSDAAGHVLYLNPAGRRMLGFGADEDLTRTRIADYHPRWAADLIATVGIPAALRDGAWSGETTLLMHGGREVPVSQVILAHAPAEGGPVLSTIMRDLTERKRAEEALRENARVLLESQRVARLGSYRLDLVSGTWTSSAILDEIFGIADPAFRRDVPGWLSIVHPDQREEMAAYFTEEVLGKRQTFDREYQIARLTDGEERWVHGLGHLVADSEGRLVEMIGTIQDITERKRAEAERAQVEGMLRQSQKLEGIGRLAGGVAHDFNNILGVITGYGELMRRQIPEEHPARPRLEQVLKAAERAAGLTRQLLAFSRKQVMQPKILDLSLVVRNLGKMLDRVVGEDVEMEVRAAPDLGVVTADPTQVEQVIMNLVVNARDAMPEGGHLTIETANADFDEAYAASHPPARPGRFVVLAVSDSGVGMDAETQRHIFEPFFTTKPAGEGTGLGLATVYGVVKQSGGYVWVYSEPGRGTTFKVYLPRVEEETGAGEAAPAAAAAAGGDETVLVVEDTEALREVVREGLEELGYRVLAAGDGEEALAIAKAHQGPIHLLLSDVVMPKLGGPALARRVVELRPGIRVVYMSGYSDGAVARQGVLAPGVTLLEKPFTGEALARAVREALDRPNSS